MIGVNFSIVEILNYANCLKFNKVNLFTSGRFVFCCNLNWYIFFEFINFIFESLSFLNQKFFSSSFQLPSDKLTALGKHPLANMEPWFVKSLDYNTPWWRTLVLCPTGRLEDSRVAMGWKFNIRGCISSPSLRSL